MANQAAMGMSIHNVDTTVAAFSANDVQVLRRLSEQVSEIAVRSEQQEKRKVWHANNALEPLRPVVFCDPENGWNEIILESDCECENGLARNIEYTLRKEIFWGNHMGDDKVVDAVFALPHVYSSTGWGFDTDNKIGSDVYGHAYTWAPGLKDYKTDLARLQKPELVVDMEASERLLALVRDAIGDYLDVQLKTAWWWSFGLTGEYIFIRGLEQLYYDVMDYPDELHKAMAVMRDGYMSQMDFLEEHGLLSLNNDNTYVGSGGFGFTGELPAEGFTGKVRTRDMWGFSESQETVCMSPAMFEEFVFSYQLPILERFGLNCYGCCEPLDIRWHVVKKTPRLRRVSISAWADIEKSAGLLEDRYIFSYKPAPSYLAMRNMDKEYIRASIRDFLQQTKGCCVEIIMKDNNTLGGNPSNATEWCRIVKEEVDRFCGG
ncbi:MAG: hypothetical protein FWG03_03360 [Clostridiales bacterium]|nr:hypothetical protein [Clostridiales bacterium]